MDNQGDDILGKKKLNYEFLMLVRDKKYPEALVLGKKILETEPNNPAVKKFCDFILANNKQLQKMVQEQKQEEQYESADSDDEQGGQQEAEGEQKEERQGQSQSEDDDKDSNGKQDEQQQEQEEQAEKQEKPKPKVQLTTCSLNQFPHICTRDHK